MSRSSLLVTLSLLLAPSLLLAQQTTVYKSKNADGTSVYTQIETRGAESRQVRSKSPEAQAMAEAAPKTDIEIACERSQLNIALLDSGKVLQRDKDGDGKPEDLTLEELAAERALSQSQVTAYCPKPEA